MNYGVGASQQTSRGNIGLICLWIGKKHWSVRLAVLFAKLVEFNQRYGDCDDARSHIVDHPAWFEQNPRFWDEDYASSNLSEDTSDTEDNSGEEEVESLNAKDKARLRNLVSAFLEDAKQARTNLVGLSSAERQYLHVHCQMLNTWNFSKIGQPLF